MKDLRVFFMIIVGVLAIGFAITFPGFRVVHPPSRSTPTHSVVESEPSSSPLETEVVTSTLQPEFRKRLSSKLKDMPIGSSAYIFLAYCVDLQYRVLLDPEWEVYLESDNKNVERRSDGYYFRPGRDIASPSPDCHYPITAHILSGVVNKF